MTIYILSFDDLVVDIIEGYATNEEDIKRLAARHYWPDAKEGDLEITYSNSGVASSPKQYGWVTVTDKVENDSIFYKVWALERIPPLTLWCRLKNFLTTVKLWKKS